MKLLMPRQATEIRAEFAAGRTAFCIEYGRAVAVTGTGRATCRACGAKIAKGEAAIRFPWDFHSQGSFTASDAQIHVRACV